MDEQQKKWKRDWNGNNKTFFLLSYKIKGVVMLRCTFNGIKN